MIEKVDSLSFIAGSVKRYGRMVANTAYEDIGNVVF
jgi:hypothetical protein